MGYSDNTYMRYSLEDGVSYYMYGGTVSSTCLVNGVSSKNCTQKYSVKTDGTINQLVSNYSYSVTSKSWYTGCRNYGSPTWSGLSNSSFNGIYLQHFTAPIYEVPNLKTVRGVAAVSLNLAYCKYIR